MKKSVCVCVCAGTCACTHTHTESLFATVGMGGEHDLLVGVRVPFISYSFLH